MKNRENIINWVLFISIIITVLLFIIPSSFSIKDSDIFSRILNTTFIISILCLILKWIISINIKKENIQKPLSKSSIKSNKSVNKKSNSNNFFQSILMKHFSDFEKTIKAKNDGDFPCEYWYNIIKQRSGMMKNSANLQNLSMTEIHDEWIWSHCDEYINKYYNFEHTVKVDLISNRLDNYSYILNAILDLETNVQNLMSQVKDADNPLLDTFEWDKISISSSFYGSVKYALHIGMSKKEIISLCNNIDVNFDSAEGSNPWDKLKSKMPEDALDENGTPSQKYVDEINEKMKEFGFKFNKRDGGGIEAIQVNESVFSDLNHDQRCSLFFIFLQIANSDGISDEENKILQDVLLELDISADEFNKSNIDGNTAVELLQDLNPKQKNRLSEIISLVVGADGEFSADELFWVNDIVKELELDISLVSNLMSRYWTNKN